LHLRLLPQSPGGNRRALALGTHLVVGHYSNGQQGCFYANQSGVDPDCTPAEGQLPLNELTGDFSTNFVRGEVHARLVLGLDPTAESAWALGGSVGVELNSGLGPGGITRQQRAVYGDGSYQLQLQGERHWHGHRAHAAVSLSQPFGGLPGQGVTVTPELSLSPRWAAGFGLYARYVHGRDYYNILFLEPVRLWQFGLVFELGPGTRLREAVMQQRPHSP
ncbi:MAG TPA: hypothetical protein VFO83_02540, partial [Aggregicoccus sp.]|nr:hypothetical protein [Aggregicoccus sp.]